MVCKIFFCSELPVTGEKLLQRRRNRRRRKRQLKSAMLFKQTHKKLLQSCKPLWQTKAKLRYLNPMDRYSSRFLPTCLQKVSTTRYSKYFFMFRVNKDEVQITYSFIGTSWISLPVLNFWCHPPDNFFRDQRAKAVSKRLF